MMTYSDFIQSKKPLAQLSGFVPVTAPHESLKPHQRDIALWMVRGGRRAGFLAFGLGKTRIHLQVAKWICEHENKKPCLICGNICTFESQHDHQPTTPRKYLIIAPLGVRYVFVQEEGPAMGIEVEYCRTDGEVAQSKCQIIITNYERVRDGQITVTPEVFSGVGLDEASVLRSFGSKTYQSFLTMFAKIDYRFVFTATPSPNRHKELIHYAGFLGVMDTGQALTRFFKRDSQKAGNLTLMPSMEAEFLDWLSSWSCFLQKPSDLGYDDTGYIMPGLEVEWVCVPVDHTKAWAMIDSWGQHQLFLDKSSGLKDLAEVKRSTIVTRIAKAKEIIDAHPGDNFILWHELEEERRVIEKAIPNVKTIYGTQDLEKRENIILEFSGAGFGCLGTKPQLSGSGCNLQHHCHRAIFLGSSYKFNDFIQSVHRILRFQQKHIVTISIIYTESEDAVISSIKEKWAQHNELVAHMSELLKRYKLDLETMQIIRKTGCDRVEILSDKFRAINNDCVLELMAKNIDNECNIYNISRHANISSEVVSEKQNKTSEICEAVQKQESKDGATLASGMVCKKQEKGEREEFTLEKAKPRKGKNELPSLCQKTQGEAGSKNAGMVQSKHSKGTSDCAKVDPETALRSHNGDVSGNEKQTGWQVCDLPKEIQNKKSSGGSLPQNGQGAGDSLLEVQHGIGPVPRRSEAGDKSGGISGEAWPDDCVDLICSSLPFGNQYEYSANHSDFGYAKDNAQFFVQMDYLVPNLLRVLKPGRLACIHVKDRIRFGGQHGTGVPTVDRFSDKTADLFERHGFFFLGRITIDTDVVRENAQTYRLGWSENAKDSTKMGVGMQEYVLLFRKPQTERAQAYADVPVTKDKEVYMRSDWQVDAAGFWKSDGNRLPDPDIMANMPMDAVRRLWIAHSKSKVYRHKEHVDIAKEMEKLGYLPSSWMLFAPISNNPGIWTDIARMRVLNAEQDKQRKEKHVCPLQLDICNRLIGRYSNPGEVVLDPFAGIFTVPYCAVNLGRIGWGIELANEYWHCGVGYCEQAEREHNMPTLFDMLDAKVATVETEPETANVD